MSGKPSLLYFDLTGRGEIIRLLYRFAGVEFEDRRITFAEFPAYKTNRKTLFSHFLHSLLLLFFFTVQLQRSTLIKS